jgi:hypothetical protein
MEPSQNVHQDSVPDVTQDQELREKATEEAAADFKLLWNEQIVIVALIIVAFLTSLESTAIGPPLSLSSPYPVNGNPQDC